MKTTGAKLLALLLALMMVLSIVACTATPTPAAEKPAEEKPAADKPAEAKPAESTTAADKPAAAEAPAAKPVLKVAICPNPSVTDYDDNYMTKLFEERLGIDIEFVYLPASTEDAITKISLWATDPNAELPDVIVGGDLFDNNAKELGEAGLLLDWTKYRDDPNLMPTYCALPDDVKAEIDFEMMEVDGAMYDFPQYNYNFWNMCYFRWWINKDWLEKLNLQVPTTTEELKNVLIAFRDQDPNGNGLKDEIPLSGMAGNDTYGNNVVYSILNSFIYFDGFIRNTGLSLETDGKTVFAPYTTEEWKEGLRYVKDLYDEGLLTSAFFTNTWETLSAQVNAKPNVTGVVCSGSKGLWADRNNPEATYNDMQMIGGTMIGPKGLHYSIMNPDVCWSFGAVVNGPNYELALKFMDYCYSEEMARVTDYGEYGVNWTDDPEQVAKASNVYVQMGIVDQKDLYGTKLNEVWDEANNIHWWNAIPAYYPNEHITKMGQLDENYDWLKAINAANNDYEYEYLLPDLKFTADEYDELSEAIALIPGYVDESLASFITGQKDLDKDWDSYLKELNNMGLEKLVAASQAAFDRQK